MRTGPVPWVVAAAAMIGAVAASNAESQQLPQATGGAQWMNFNNRLDGQRYSPLTQISPRNATQLREVCRIAIDGPASFTAGLIVVDGVIFTNTGRQTVAVDATNCRLRWRQSWVPEDEEPRQSSRGPAVLDGRVFRGTGDGRLIALDAATGKLLWSNAIGVPRLSEFASAAPLAWQGMVFMGVGGGDAGARGRVMAYDASTGRELWRFHTIPMGRETGADTWKKPETARTGGGGIWGAMTLDAATGELFVPVGNPWPDIDSAYRPGDNLFTNSIVVLDAQTGALKWWHQAVPADTNDFDLAAAPVLYRDSRIRDVAAFVGKDGNLTALDRETRQPVFRTPLVATENHGLRATPEGRRVCPGFAGGTGWNGPALDRLNNTLLVGTRQGGCMTIRPAPTVYAPPAVNYGGSVTPDPADVPSGTVTAVDAASGAIRWVHRMDDPVVAGITPTAGGVTFAGDLGGVLRVLDSRTGVLLHSVDTKGSMAGGLVTYQIGNTQYVAMASGNVSRVATRVTGIPSIVIMALEGSQKPAAATRGQALYMQVCSSCHGADGNLVADRKLGTLRQRRDSASTVAYLKDPKPPMPKLYPAILSEQDIQDLASYVLDSMQGE